jgi:hypothetical protein
MDNRTIERKAPHEIEPSVIAAIQELNIMDQALYEYGNSLVKERAVSRGKVDAVRVG